MSGVLITPDARGLDVLSSLYYTCLHRCIDRHRICLVSGVHGISDVGADPDDADGSDHGSTPAVIKHIPSR